jgi:hypothetical protein
MKAGALAVSQSKAPGRVRMPMMLAYFTLGLTTRADSTNSRGRAARWRIDACFPCVTTNLRRTASYAIVHGAAPSALSSRRAAIHSVLSFLHS